MCVKRVFLFLVIFYPLHTTVLSFLGNATLFKHEDNAQDSKAKNCAKFNQEGKINITAELFSLLESNFTVREITQKLFNVSQEYEKFVPVDVSLVGQVFEKVSLLEKNELQLFAGIISNLLEIDESVLFESQTEFQATSRLMKCIAKITQQLESDFNFINITTTNFLLIVLDLKEINATGLAVYTKIGSTYVKLLPPNASVSEISKHQNFDSAVMFHPKLKTQMDSKIAINIFLKPFTLNHISSRTIFGIFSNHSDLVSVYYKISGTNELKMCAGWSNSSTWEQYNSTNTSIETLISCTSRGKTHLTVVWTYQSDSKPQWTIPLVINLLCCIFSTLGFCGIALTAILFKNWRCNTGNQILLNFVFAMLAQFVLSVVVNAVNMPQGEALCYSLGIMRHYFTLSQFSWMFVFAILQFKRFVVVLGRSDSNILLKSCLLGWLLPFLPVVTLLIVDHENYEKDCFPRDFPLLLSVWGPISTIVVINFLIFVYIFYHILYKSASKPASYNNGILNQWRTAVLLFFLLGVNWLFAILYAFFPDNNIYNVLVISTNLQGCVIFLYFIVCNKRTRNLYLKMFKTCCNEN